MRDFPVFLSFSRARDHFHAAVIDGKLYAAGGRRSHHAIGQVANLTEAAVDV